MLDPEVRRAADAFQDEEEVFYHGDVGGVECEDCGRGGIRGEPCQHCGGYVSWYAWWFKHKLTSKE